MAGADAAGRRADLLGGERDHATEARATRAAYFVLPAGMLLAAW